MTRSRGLLSVVWLASVAANGVVADWPQWRGPNRDGKSTETGLQAQWPAGGPRRLWTAEGLGEGYSTVAVVDGLIYATGMVPQTHQGVLSAFDLGGDLKWRTPYGPEWHTRYPGARSTPTVDGDRVYVLSGMGRLVCCDATTGAIRWSKHVAKEFGGEPPACGFAESVLVHDHQVICTPGGKDASLVALNKTTGRTIWTSKGLSEQSAYCSPILVERADKRLLVTITARSVVGLSVDTGDPWWRQPQDPDAKDPNHSVTPVYGAGHLYATSGHGQGGQLLAVSPDGRQVRVAWTDKTLNSLHGGVVLVDGHLYGSNLKGRWACLRLTTGEVMYEAKGVGRGSVAYADGKLYCYGEKGTVALVPASPTGYKPVSRFTVRRGNGRHWAHPVICGGRLYLRHGDCLMAFDIRARSGPTSAPHAPLEQPCPTP